MKITKMLLIVICFICNCFSASDKFLSNLSIFSDANTDIVLIVSKNNLFTLVGYGGSTRECADCVIVAEGFVDKNNFSGFLKDVATPVVSYEINDSLKHRFTAFLNGHTLKVVDANVLELCSINSNFAREYEKVIDQKEFQRKVKDFLELFEGNNANDELLSILKNAAPQTTINCGSFSILNGAHKKAFEL